jgi:hypothetical protein
MPSGVFPVSAETFAPGEGYSSQAFAGATLERGCVLAQLKRQLSITEAL